MFAGHDSQLTQLALSRSCTNRETGDVCEFAFLLDAWLTQDPKLGLDSSNPLLQKQMRQFLAPYADSLKELSSKAADFKGYPLKTTNTHCVRR